ncbi:MAG: lipid-A-disaccharide synthase N-terminal domain-containing protein, partial [Bacteroidales bacterium]|nr:lipid-A-disaccharide synthase N-terminal domain-containing protein [Bacteroidales bacterium]
MKWLYIIGFLAQALFSARLLLQWLLSERSRQVVSPSVYWILSIAGSYLLFIYGWLRDDFAIIFGQFISYY